MLRFADFEIDLERAELRRSDGEVLHLRPKALALLDYLLQNVGRIVSKQELMEVVWPNVHVGEDSLFQCIREVRNAIGDDQRRLIKAVSGRGYMLDAVVTAPASHILEAADNSVSPRAPAQGALDILELAGPKPARARFTLSLGRRTAFVGAGAIACVIGLAVAIPFLGPRLSAPRPPVIAVMPIVAASTESDVEDMAANVTSVLTDGLSRIPNIRVLARTTQSDAQTISASSVRPDLILRSELARSSGSWQLQARVVDAVTNEVRWTTSYSVDATSSDADLERSRLAAGIGYPLAAHISAMNHSGLREGTADIVVKQATDFINSTSRERFDTAQAMLEKALAADPSNVDLQAAVAAQLLRGIQTAWYRGHQAEAAEREAKDLLARALRSKPNYVPVLENNCRFLTATNQFVDSLVACAKALSFDPWDGVVLFQMGMSQLQLGRFDDALATFREADRSDTPQVSRWTWLLGAGLTYVMMDRNGDAVPWLQRSLAITPGTGRTHFVLAAAYERLGLHDEAKAAIAEGMKLRPNSNSANVSLPTENASPLFLRRSEQVKGLMVAAGLPRQ